jgi:integrase/recombinase XerD
MPQSLLCVWALLETGLRVSELATLRRDQIQWQQRAIRVKGKGGQPYGKRSKFRVVPLSDRLRPLFEHYFSLHESFPYTTRWIPKSREARREPGPHQPPCHSSSVKAHL